MNQSQTIEILTWKFENYFWVGNFNFAHGVFLQLVHIFSGPKPKFLSREYQQYMKLGNRLLKHLVETKDFIKARDIAHELNTQVQTNKDFKKVLKNLPSEYITFTFLIGNVYDGLKETDKAIKFYSKGLEHCTHKKIKTENYKIVLKRIATLLLEKNQEKEALDYFKKLLNQKSEKNDLEETDVYSTMGEILKNQGNLKQSIKYYLQAWESTKNEKLREDIILKRIDICSKLAESYIAIDEEQNALRFETESSNLKKRVFGKESQEYKKSLKKLAEMHMKLKNYEACCECYLTYHKLLKKEGVSTSKELEDSISYLADAYFICGNYKEALALYKQHAEVIEKTYGPRNKRYLKIQDNIAKTLFKSEIYKTSLDVQLASLAIKKQVYHKNDIELVIALNNIGLTYYALNRYEDALASHFKSLEALEVQSPVHGNRGKEYILLSIALDYRKLENSSKGLEYIYESFKSGDQAAQEEPTNPENALEFYDTVGEHMISGLNFDKVARET